MNVTAFEAVYFIRSLNMKKHLITLIRRSSLQISACEMIRYTAKLDVNSNDCIILIQYGLCCIIGNAMQSHHLLKPPPPRPHSNALFRNIRRPQNVAFTLLPEV